MPLPKLPYKGECTKCNEEIEPGGESVSDVFIVRRNPPLCAYHNNQYKMEKSKVKRPRVKPKKIRVQWKRKPTGEGVLFKEIWDDFEPEERVSFVTNNLLRDVHFMRAWYFSHVLPKGKYPHFRLNKENIVFMSFEEHETWEHKKYKIKDDPSWSHVFELEARLKEEYKLIHQ